MFDGIPTAPPDAIFGLIEAFRADPHPDKINLGAGIYRDEQGRTPIPEAVKQVERLVWEREASKSYLVIAGDPRFAALVAPLLLGRDHPLIESGRLVTAHTPGGTGAIRVAAELLRTQRPGCTAWLPEPTWINHAQILAAAGLPTRTFPYLDAARRELDFEALSTVLAEVPANDVVILHGCCHNPSGVDPTPDQWSAIGELMASRGVVPLIDIAYQGFGEDLVEDTRGLKALCQQLDELVICTSFSKNFALYNERVGALTVIARTAGSAAAVLSQIKLIARACYSNPPAHGAAIVAGILEDDGLRRQWSRELAAMRDRIQEMRRLFVAGLDGRGVELAPDGNGFLLHQRGMFSFSGLEPAQVERLRSEHSIYMVASGRINFAGMTPGNMERLCDAVALVV